MKHTKISILALAVLLNSGLALAQHGHGASGNMGAADHKSMKGGSNNASRHETVSDLLSKNSKLSNKLQTLTGMSAQKACSGFKNLGQCVAAAHVSKNLGISFACMKADMTDQAPAQGSSCPAGTGSKSMSLGKSIQALRPNVNQKLEAKKAEKQADADIKNSDNS
jgi:hypothetical protein